jgi:hypothetical protein
MQISIQKTGKKQGRKKFLEKISKKAAAADLKPALARKSYHILYAHLCTCEIGGNSYYPDIHENTVGRGFWKIHALYELARTGYRYLLRDDIADGDVSRI